MNTEIFLNQQEPELREPIQKLFAQKAHYMDYLCFYINPDESVDIRNLVSLIYDDYQILEETLQWSIELESKINRLLQAYLLVEETNFR